MTLSEQITIPISDNLLHPLPSLTMVMPPIPTTHHTHQVHSDFVDDDQTSDSNPDSSSSSNAESNAMEEQPASPQTTTSRSTTSDTAPHAGRLESFESKIPQHVATVRPTSAHPNHVTTAQHHKSQPASARQMDQRAARQEALKHDAAEIKRQRHQNAAGAKKHHDEQENDKLRQLQIQKAERDLIPAVRSSKREDIRRSRHLPVHYYSPHRHEKRHDSRSTATRQEAFERARYQEELDRKAAYSNAMHNEAIVRASKDRVDALRPRQYVALVGRERALAARERALAAEKQRKAAIFEYARALAAHNARLVSLHRPHFVETVPPSYMQAIRERQIRAIRERQELHDMQVAHNQRIYDQAQYKHAINARTHSNLLHPASPEETHGKQGQQHKQQQTQREQQREHAQQLADQQEQIVALEKQTQELQEKAQQNQITNLKNEAAGLQREKIAAVHGRRSLHNKPGE